MRDNPKTYCECEAEGQRFIEGVCTECGLPSFHDQSLWNATEADRSLSLERSVNPTETEEQLAKRLLREALPHAAMSLAHLALHSPNERIRLDASKSIIERNLGKVGEQTNTEQDPWTEFLGDVKKFAETANSSEGN